MTWNLTGDWESYLTAVGAFLRADPVENTVALSVVEALRTGGADVFGPDPLFGWWSGPSGVGGAFLRTGAYPLLLSAMPERRAETLAETLTGRALPGVNGEAAAARAFAATWERRTGEVASVHMRQRLYRLDALETPTPAAGKPRGAGTADLALVSAWFADFERESGAAGAASSRLAEDRLTYGRVLLWEVDGEPVSLAGRTPTVAGMSRIGPVYTPPAHRRKGYGTAVTAELTRTALDAGASHVVLFTDLANPTSNGVYQRIGYRPVSDRLVLSFSAT
jgi:GNAT superfamily N-acetyltransferase